MDGQEGIRKQVAGVGAVVGPREADLPSKANHGLPRLQCPPSRARTNGQGGCNSSLGLGVGGKAHLPGFTWGGSGHGR